MLLGVYILIFLIYILSVPGIKKKPLYRFILLFYLGSMLTAFFLWNFTSDFTLYHGLSFTAILYHSVVLMFMLYPMRYYDVKLDPSNLYSIPYSKIAPFIFFLIGISSISIYTSILIIKDYSLDNILEIRNAIMIEGEGRELKPSGSLLSHITQMASEYSFITLLLAFYSVIKYPQKKLIIILLFLSSSAYLFYNLEIGGREAFVRYGIDLIIFYFIFRNSLKLSLRRKIRNSILFMFIIILLAAISVSLARFGNNQKLVFGTLGYYGQGFILFSDVFQEFSIDGLTNGKRIFGAFFSNSPISSFNLNQQFSTNIALNSFSTFVGSFVGDLGAIKAIIPYTLFFYFCILVNKVDSRSIFFYIYVLWIVRFFIGGIFYWIDDFSMLSRIFYILIILVLHLLYTQSKTKYQLATSKIIKI
jgi:hypothetical protein